MIENIDSPDTAKIDTDRKALNFSIELSSLNYSKIYNLN